MDFALTDEQRLIVDTTRAFVEAELYPHEAEVERTGHLRREVIDAVKAKAIAAGLYAANIPEEFGGAGLDTLTWLLYERELGRANYALHWTCVARPSNILCAGTPEQRATLPRPLRPRREMGLPRHDRARRRLRPARHEGDRAARTATTGSSTAPSTSSATPTSPTSPSPSWRPARRRRPRGRKKRITAFFVDKGTPGFTVRDGYRNVSHRGYTNQILEFDNVRLPAARRPRRAAPGLRGGQRLARRHPPAGRRHLPRPRRARLRPRRRLGRDAASSSASRSASSRASPSSSPTWRPRCRRAELLLWHAAWKYDQGTATDADMAMAKLKATEMLAFVADEAIQIHGGMGLMDELPLERIWRDARVERIWEGTSEIQRHIISRALLRPLGA